jgi:hypothetical protein
MPRYLLHGFPGLVDPRLPRRPTIVSSSLAFARGVRGPGFGLHDGYDLLHRVGTGLSRRTARDPFGQRESSLMVQLLDGGGHLVHRLGLLVQLTRGCSRAGWC